MAYNRSVSQQKENSILEAEKYIREADYTIAAEILETLKEEEEFAGRAAFDAGNIALLQGDFEEAWRHYEESLSQGYCRYSVYQNMAVIKEQAGEYKKSEELYRISIEKTAGHKESWLALVSFGLFYYRNDMLLKAERIAGKLMELFPDNFQGHHMFFLIMTKKKEYHRIEEHFLEVKEHFGKEPQYLIDCLANLENQKKTDEELEILENNSVYTEIIPELALHKKAHLYLQKGKQEEVRKILKTLYLEYGNLNGAFSTMLFLMVDGNYIEAGKTANLILQSERENQGIIYHLTLYLQIFILYYAFQEEPPETVQEFMRETAASCRKWFVENGFEVSEMDGILKMIIG